MAEKSPFPKHSFPRKKEEDSTSSPSISPHPGMATPNKDNDEAIRNPPYPDTLSFITDICGILKQIKRTGWTFRKIPLPESDSDHMHRCAMCAMLLSQPPDPRDDYSSDVNKKFYPTTIDHTKLLRMALTHDVCEALAGDITPFCDAELVASRHDREDAAMREIRSKVGDPLGKELYDLWREYEEQETVEALYCKDIDKFEMVVQAYEYEKMHLRPRMEVEDVVLKVEPKIDTEEGHKCSPPDVFSAPLRQFFESTNSTIKSPLFKRLDRELRNRREVMIGERGWDVTEQEGQK